MTNEEILKQFEDWKAKTDKLIKITGHPEPCCFVCGISLKFVDSVVNAARADERKKVIEQVKKLPTKPDACYCGKPNCYQFREWVELKKVLKAIKQTK